MRRKRQPPDLLIVFAVAMLLVIGMVMVFSSSGVPSSSGTMGAFSHGLYYLRKQLVWALLGTVALLVAMLVDYCLLKRWAGYFLLGGVLLLVAVLVPGVGKEVSGSVRWIDVGPLSFAPSEAIKLCMVIFLAASLSRCGENIQFFWKGMVPHLTVLGVVVGLVLAQPDLGTAVSIGGTAYLLFVMAGARTLHLAILAVLGVAGVVAAIIMEPYRLVRFFAFLDPWKYPLKSGFQIIQSLYALGSGGLFGVGLGRSHQKMFYLPEQHTDFIFSILGEELGYLGVLVVLGLFFLLIWRGFRTALTCPDSFGCFLAAGITCMIGLQAVINIGVVSGVLPVTGIPLPFISYGGSSLLFNMIGTGILLSVSRHCGGT